MGGGGFLGLGDAPDTSAQDAGMSRLNEQERRNDQKLEFQRAALATQRVQIIKSMSGGGSYDTTAPANTAAPKPVTTEPTQDRKQGRAM